LGLKETNIIFKNMNKVYIHLTGIIGLPKEGMDPSDFVQLQDITSQWEKAKKDSAEPITDLVLKIQSPGGNIVQGDLIYDFLESLKKNNVKITTQSNGMVGSMATKIFMVGDERIIQEDDEFFIHNPQGAPQGDSNDVQAYLDTMKEVEKEMVNYYTKATGAEKKAIELLMDNATTLTAQEAVDMGFATKKIGSGAEVVDVAMMLNTDTKKTNQELNPNTMTKIKDTLEGLFTSFKKELRAELNLDKTPEADAKAKRLTALKAQFPNVDEAKLEAFVDFMTSEGKLLTVNADNEDELVGADAVFMEEDGNMTIVEAGDYPLDDGRTLVVGEGGKVTELKTAETEEAVEALKAQIAAKDQEILDLKASQISEEKLEQIIEEKMKPIQEAAETTEGIQAELEAVKSHYNAPENKTFRRDPSQLSLKDKMEAAKSELVPQKSTAQKAKDSLG
tara:strand:- start:3390 stop:4736 length:1347 start_codon:yes stop_codon:yes gene_type:complete